MALNVYGYHVLSYLHYAIVGLSNIESVQVWNVERLLLRLDSTVHYTCAQMKMNEHSSSKFLGWNRTWQILHWTTVPQIRDYYQMMK